MSWTLILRPKAERDVSQARQWYDRHRDNLGGDFLESFAAAMQRLASDPTGERPYYRDFRRAILHRFPYKIFYRVIGSRVVVFRVLHAKQDHVRQLERN